MFLVFFGSSLLFPQHTTSYFLQFREPKNILLSVILFRLYLGDNAAGLRTMDEEEEADLPCWTLPSCSCACAAVVPSAGSDSLQ